MEADYNLFPKYIINKVIWKEDMVMTKGNKANERLGVERLNKQACLMKIVEYNNTCDIVVEFQDEYRAKIHTSYQNFLMNEVKNPYCPDVFDVGMIGIKYPSKVNGKNTKEYNAWFSMLERCYYKKYREVRPTYENIICCNEWLLFENFYDWLHNQENFDKWLNGKGWSLDKDILFKGNKIYSPDTCCLVPMSINNLFTKSDKARGDLPIGVTYHKRVGKYSAKISKLGDNGKYREHIGYYPTSEQAFQAYKKAKESYIKQVAQTEYSKGNITEECYEAMMNYEVEIID